VPSGARGPGWGPSSATRGEPESCAPPVRPGRNLTTIIEVAARNYLLKAEGPGRPGFPRPGTRHAHVPARAVSRRGQGVPDCRDWMYRGPAPFGCADGGTREHARGAGVFMRGSGTGMSRGSSTATGPSLNALSSRKGPLTGPRHAAPQRRPTIARAHSDSFQPKDPLTNCAFPQQR
jgi:hypothetical protein